MRGSRVQGPGSEKKIKFTKAVATGNDFVVIDNRNGRILGLSKLAIRLCDRKWGVGADGLLVAERSKRADLRMRIFNSDGSEAEMCGNGSRCMALYAKVKGLARANMNIETMAGILTASVKNEGVMVRLTNPRDMALGVSVKIGGRGHELCFVNTGVPHAVYFVDDIEKVDVKGLGSAIRFHEAFAPRGTNADFVEIIDKKNIKVRTYERGVEDETLACGTGSVASAILSAECANMTSPVNVQTRSGERLKVHFERSKGVFKDVYLEGKAKLVFEGAIKV
jgi:diaminopimelate epimerase